MHSHNQQLLASAYGTGTLQGLLAKSKSIAEAIEETLLIDSDSEYLTKIGTKIIAVKGDIERIANFYHPIILNNKAYIDIRPFLNKFGEVKNMFEYSLLLRRARLDLAWVLEKELFLSQENFIIDTFSSWFSHGLQRNTNANLLTSTYFRIIAAIYYLGFFNTQHFTRDDEISDYILSRLPKMLRIPTPTIDELVMIDEEKIHALFKLGHSETVFKLPILAELITALTDRSLLIDKGVIYTALVRGAFMASNAPEIAAVALEHPPTFVAMLSCVTLKGFQNNTALGRTAMGTGRNHNTNFDKFLTEIATVGD